MLGAGGQKRVTPEFVLDYRFNLPTLIEQRKIADFLDRETAKIDALISEKERLLKLLDERRQALITEAVTRGLDPTVPMKPSGLPWLGDIPAHWTIKKLKYMFGVVGGGTPSKEKPEYWDGEIPWVSPKDMKTDRINDTEEHVTELGVKESASQLVNPGAVLIVCRSGILKHSIPVAINDVSVTLNQDMRALIPTGQMSATYMKWLVWSLQSALLAEWSKAGATVESLEYEFMFNCQLPVPPADEQKVISLFALDISSQFATVVRDLEANLALLKNRRSALIHEAVTGRLHIGGTG
jgi:type I restriction enzyme, S subunit